MKPGVSMKILKIKPLCAISLVGNTQRKPDDPPGGAVLVWWVVWFWPPRGYSHPLSCVCVSPARAGPALKRLFTSVRRQITDSRSVAEMLRWLCLCIVLLAQPASAMKTLRATNRRMAVAAGLAATSVAVATSASANNEKPKFQRLSPIQFIAALGDPTASSGTGAEQWGAPASIRTAASLCL